MIQRVETAKILFNGTMWIMSRILHNGRFVCLSASPEQNEHIIKYGYSKEELIDKIVNDNGHIITTPGILLMDRENRNKDR